MDRVGLPELLVIPIFLFFYLLPIAAGVWALVTLHRIRIAQEAMRLKLDSIERSLQHAAT